MNIKHYMFSRYKFWIVWIALCFSLGVTLITSPSAQANLYFSLEQDGTFATNFTLDQGNIATTFIDLIFGTTSAQLRYDVSLTKFILNKALQLSGTGTVLELGDGTSNDFALSFNDGNARTLTWDDASTRFTFNTATRIEGNQATVGQTYIASDHAASDSDGIVNIGRNASTWENITFDATTDDQFEVSDNVEVTGSILSTEVEKTTASTIAIDWEEANQQSITLNQTGHTVTFSNYNPGQTLRLIVCQDGTGSRTITTWPSVIDWASATAPTLTTTANKCDVMTFLTTNERGNVEVFGSYVLNF